jgi:CheY-like chemotaxis protein
MMTESSKTVLAVLDDLFFNVKIADAAKRAGLELIVVKSAEAALAKLAEKPLLVILDLNYAPVDPVKLASAMKATEFRSVPVIGYASHVQTELRQRAQEAGCDRVIARSAFSSNMSGIFREQAGLPQ